MRWTIELAPSAARAFRSLPRASQRVLAERLEQLATGGLPPLADVTVPGAADVVLVPAGDYRLVCIGDAEDSAVLVAAIEPLRENAGSVIRRLFGTAVTAGLAAREPHALDQNAWLRPSNGHPLPSVHSSSSRYGLMDLLVQVRRSFRTLRREPGIAVLAVAALALGIGLPTAMFTLVNAMLLRGLPVDDPEQIVHLERRPIGASGEGWGAAARDYVAWSEQQRTFEQLAAMYTGTVTLRTGEGADRWNAAHVTASMFDILRTAPALGRAFRPGDGAPGSPGVVLLGHTIWRDRFAAEPGVLGETVWVDGAPHTVIGVMPPAFRFPSAEDVWLPIVVDAAAAQRDDLPAMSVVGRLRPGADIEQARAELALVAARLAEQHPESNGNMTVAVKPFTERMMGETPTVNMLVMLAAVLLVLVVACLNVAHLLLVRAVHRMRDLAVRAALGASRVRIFGELLTESAVLAVFGGILGIGVAFAGVRGLHRTIGPERLPYWADLRLDGSALLFALVLTAAAALLAGVLPAFKATGRDPGGTLRDESRGSTGLRIGRVMQGLIVLEIALSLALLVVTGLLVRSVLQVQDVHLGFATEDVFTARITLPDGYEEDAQRRFHDALLRSLRDHPSTAVAALATSVPATRASRGRFTVEGVTYASEDALPVTGFAAVSDGFFAAYGVEPERGRLLGPQDGPDAVPVAVVNRRFAARFLDGDAIGRRIRLGTSEDAPWRTVVGVVPDLYIAGLDASGERNPAGVYVPLSQSPAAGVSIVVRTRGEPLAIAPTVRELTFALDRDVPVYDVRSMPRVIVDNSWFYGMGATIMGACGAAALLLAAIGLYGVISFTVRRRFREFGIRMALGARPADIRSLVMRRGSLQVAIGLAIGLTLAAVIARGVASLLFDVSPTDPLVYGGTAALLAGIAALATLLPAVRAARVNPVASLRMD